MYGSIVPMLLHFTMMISLSGALRKPQEAVDRPFCGGVGGWTSALQMISDSARWPVHSIGTVVDFQVAKTYALNHNAAVICPKDFLLDDIFQLYGHN